MTRSRLVFVCGLHRSGTSPLYRALAAHKDVSALPKEGQTLQSIYPRARDLGGPGRFGFDTRSHLTETSASGIGSNATMSSCPMRTT